MQRAFINKMYELAAQNRDIVYLNADNGTDYDVLFSRAFPEQYYNMGIAEENMVAAAAGMALCGKIPFVCSNGAFLAYRAYEFIRNDVCLQRQNVKLVALGSGMSISALGPTHHTTEDISALKAIPGLAIYSLASAMEVAPVMDRAMAINGPVYLRLGMNMKRELHRSAEDISIDGVTVLRAGDAGVVFVTGDIIPAVLDACDILSAEHGAELEVDELLSLKPLDGEDILRHISGRRHVFCAEEHNVIGGLADSIACLCNAGGVPKPVHRIGLEDCFADGFGPQHQVQEYNGLGPRSIAERLLSVLKG